MKQSDQYIFEIYKTGSIRKAAANLHITQPALSIALRHTEEDLGTILFDRSTHPLTLTPAGQIYLNGLHEIHNIEQNVLRQVKEASSPENGIIRIGASTYYVHCVLTPLLHAFMSKYPNIKFELSEAGTNTNLEKLAKQDLDLLFTARVREHPDYNLTPIGQGMMLVAVPTSFMPEDKREKFLKHSFTREDILAGKHLKAHYASKEITDFLSTVPFIMTTGSVSLANGSISSFEEMFPNFGNILMRTEQLSTAYAFCCQGIGASLVTDLMIDRGIAPGVAIYKVEGVYSPRSYSIATYKHHYQTAAALNFIEFAKNFKNGPADM